jgi:tRNA(adenine34) deaminase
LTVGQPGSGHDVGSVPAGYDDETAPWAESMRMALAEARWAADEGDVPIGAVVLSPAGDLISADRNRREGAQDATAHAEVLAIRAAGAILGSWRLTGCTLVVTLEPCAMCAGAVVLARLGRLVFGAADPKAGAVGSLYDIPGDPRLNHRPEVIGGVLAEHCGAELRAFFAARRKSQEADES